MRDWRVLLLSGLVFLCDVQAFDLVSKEDHGFVGDDRVPYSVYTIKKPSNFTDLQTWIATYYSDNTSEAVHYLPETVLELSVKGRKAIAFKAWEFEGFTQNFLIDTTRKTLTLYSTPHFQGNPDGSLVFKNKLGVVLPQTESTTLSDATYHPPVAAECDNEEAAEPESQEAPFDFSAQIQPLATCSYKCSDNKAIGDYKGISAYSNGQYTGTSSYCGTNTYGYKWQCPEYVVRFFDKIFHRWIRGGNANEYCSRASEKNLNRRWNCNPNEPDVPQPGNVIVKTSGNGHVGILKAVGSNYIDVVSQNYDRCNGVKRLSMTRKNNSSGKEYACVDIFGQSGYKNGCWMWPR